MGTVNAESLSIEMDQTLNYFCDVQMFQWFSKKEIKFTFLYQRLANHIGAKYRLSTRSQNRPSINPVVEV